MMFDVSFINDNTEFTSTDHIEQITKSLHSRNTLNLKPKTVNYRHLKVFIQNAM